MTSKRSGPVGNQAGVDRLNPSRFGRTYYHLRALRAEIERVAAEHLTAASPVDLLDFGCGDMAYRPLFQPFVRQYVGCDLPGVDAADLIMAPDGTVPVADGIFDIVLSTQVLEHVDRPDLYLSECRRLLNSQGRLILTTHGVWKYHPNPRDLWRWTSEGLRTVIEAAGFRVIDFRGVMAPASYALQIYQDATAGALPRFLQPAYFAAMQLFIQAADRFSRNKARKKDACAYVIVADYDDGRE